MAWKCMDCGNKSSRKFPAGRCPACDSCNIQGRRKDSDNKRERSELRRKIDLTVLVVCWGSLLAVLVAKLF